MSTNVSLETGKLTDGHRTSFRSTTYRVYAPTSTHDLNTIEQFYGLLHTTVDKVNSGDTLIIMGDFNAKIGKGEDTRCGVGKFGLGSRNESGDKLAEFCHVNNLIITNTTFDHHKRNLHTWKSPGDRYRNQIDYILIRRRWKSSIKDAKAFPGADCDTDHILSVAKMQIKLSKVSKIQKSRRLNVKSLEDPKTL